MEKKQCTRCKKDLEISFFNLRRGQLTRWCVKRLDICKRSRQRTKCEHGRQRSHCKACGGSEICGHNKIRSHCKTCGGSEVCRHNKIRSHCKTFGVSKICEHNRQRSRCLSCGGGRICEHNKRRSMCKGCGGGEICGHNNQRSSCKYGDPPEHLAKVVRGHVYTALKNHKEMGSTEYLGWISRRLKNILNKNLQKVCHGKIMVNGTSILRYRWNTINHHFKRLFNGCTTQIHSLCGQVKICQKDVDIFLTDRRIWGIK